MKKINKYILSGLLFCSFASCDFLETEPKDFIPADDFYKSSLEVSQAYTGVFSSLGSQNLYGNIYGTLAVYGDDLAFYARNTLPMNLPNNNFTTSSSDVANMWMELYNGINNANLFLKRIVKAEEDKVITKEQKIGYDAAITFMRAYYYFLLAQSWGDVPLVTEGYDDVATVQINVPQTSQKEVLRFVTDEMERVYWSLPETNNIGHIDRSIAAGIMARVYLKRAGQPVNEGEPCYRKARAWAGEVIASKRHQLNPSYSQIFINLAADIYDETYRESMWEVEFKGNNYDGHTATGRLGSVVGILNSDISTSSLGYSYGFYEVTLNMWNLYNDTDGDGQVETLADERNHPDVRRDWNIAPYRFVMRTKEPKVVTKLEWQFPGEPVLDVNGEPKTNASGVVTISKGDFVNRNVGKYRREYENVKPRNKNYTPINFPILRYADVLLMYAEADNEVEGHPTTVAVEYVNMVRRRANLDNASPADYNAFKQLIKDERGRELCYEGTRRFDLIRWGDYKKNLEKVAQNISDARWLPTNRDYAITYAQNGASSDRYLWLPIPTRELGLNKGLKQNPLW